MDNANPVSSIYDVDIPMTRCSVHTPDARRHAAIAWVITGTSTEAGRVTGIPHRTIQEWTQKEWWQPLVATARAEHNEQIDARFTAILDKATQVLDRKLDSAMANPDAVASIKELAVVAAVIYDKRALMRGDPTSRQERVNSSDKLQALKAQFRQIREGSTDGEVTEIPTLPKED